MALALITFLAVFVLVVSGGALLFYRAAILKRLSDVLPAEAGESGLMRQLAAARSGASLGYLVQPFHKVLPRSQEEISVVEQRLIRAGYRDKLHVNVFYASKVVVPVLLTVIATATGVYEYGAFFVYGLTLGLGFLIPDFWLSNRIAARQTAIRLGLPEALDLIVVCMEAGLSLDQAVLRTADEVDMSQPVLSDELALLNLEQRAGRPRADCWKHLADRTDVDAMRSVVAILVQVDQFGTSVAKALRIHSETLRTRRRQEAEEQAAKTTVKLVFPLVFFIFPSIFVVVLGPAMITLLEAFDKYLLN